jgi:hypothetical protein
MQRRTGKRKQPPKNQYSEVVLDDDDDPRPTIPTLVPHRHEIFGGISNGRLASHNKIFTLLSSPKKPTAGSYTLSPGHSNEGISLSQNLFPRATLDDDIDIIDYATSGNFDADFGLESVPLQQSHHNEQESTPEPKRSRNDSVRSSLDALIFISPRTRDGIHLSNGQSTTAIVISQRYYAWKDAVTIRTLPCAMAAQIRPQFIAVSIAKWWKCIANPVLSNYMHCIHYIVLKYV